MLQETSQPRPEACCAQGARVAIVASEYNRRHVDGMLDAAVARLREHDAVVEVLRVPGAFEIPVVAAALVERLDRVPKAIVCLGVIWQGETQHADHVGQAVTRALMDLQVRSQVPCVHEVLTVRSEEQARARCLDPATNRGFEAANTALAMVRLLRAVRSPDG
jgi:6,7-dimethyl-8-ribityllumazine synthase